MLELVCHLVSTHAPVKARLAIMTCMQLRRIVSTHAPVKARPQVPADRREDPQRFNPRAREGATSAQQIAP